jgi:hypothetical protein
VTLRNFDKSVDPEAEMDELLISRICERLRAIARFTVQELRAWFAAMAGVEVVDGMTDIRVAALEMSEARTLQFADSVSKLSESSDGKQQLSMLKQKCSKWYKKLVQKFDALEDGVRQIAWFEREPHEYQMGFYLAKHIHMYGSVFFYLFFSLFIILLNRFADREDEDGIRVLSCEAGVPLDLFGLAYSYSKIRDPEKKKMWICGFQDKRCHNEPLCGSIEDDDINILLRESIPKSLPAIPNSVILIPDEDMRYIDRWANWEAYAPTHVFMFNLHLRRDDWLNLMFAIFQESVDHLYTTDRFEELVFNSDRSEPYLSKIFRSIVIPVIREVRSDKTTAAETKAIVYYDLVLLRRLAELFIYSPYLLT